MTPESCRQWADERLANSERIAAEKTGDDRDGWLEDVAYWREIVTELRERASLLKEINIQRTRNTELDDAHKRTIRRADATVKVFQAIAKACADNGVSDTDDVPLADVVRGAFSQLRGQIQSLETAREFAYAEIRQLKADTALRACAEAPETQDQGWQPIETAPKDGTWIVVVGPIHDSHAPTFRGHPRACVSRWFGEDDFRESPAYAPGWCYSAPGYSGTIQPTHWRPLPAPLRAEAPATDTEPRAILPDALPSGSSSELARWRDWAQCVYLGGGRVTTSDDALRAAVCAAHDADTYVLRAAGAVGRDGFAALVHRVMAYCTEQAGDDAAAFSALVARLLPPRPGGYPMTQADMEAPATDTAAAVREELRMGHVRIDECAGAEQTKGQPLYDRITWVLQRAENRRSELAERLAEHRCCGVETVAKMQTELERLRAEALAPSPDTGLPVQTFTDTEIAAIDWALQGESVPLELRGKVIQTIALSGRRWEHAEPAPSLDTGTSTHEDTKEETKT